MYNATKGIHHTVKTDTVHHSKERNPFSPVLWSQASCAWSAKNQIGIAQEQGICVSYRRVMEVKLDIARAVCGHHAEDGTNKHPYECLYNT